MVKIYFYVSTSNTSGFSPNDTSIVLGVWESSLKWNNILSGTATRMFGNNALYVLNTNDSSLASTNYYAIAPVCSARLYPVIPSPQPCGSVRLEGGPSEPLRTLHFMSDGMFLYWLYALRAQETVPHPVTGERVKQHAVFLQTLEIKVGSVIDRSVK